MVIMTILIIIDYHDNDDYDKYTISNGIDDNIDNDIDIIY